MKARGIALALLPICMPPVYVRADDGLYLDMAEKPGRAVKTISSAHGEVLLNVEGDGEIADLYRQPGIRFPYKYSYHRTIRIKKITGRARDNGSFRIAIKIEDADSYLEDEQGASANARKDMIGMMAKGVVGSNGKVESFQLFGGSVKPEKRAALEGMMRAVLSYAEVPKRRLEVGDSFRAHPSIEIPGLSQAGLNIDHALEYRLKRIEEDAALFDVTEKFSLSSPDKTLKFDGSGAGTMRYGLSSKMLEKQNLVINGRVMISTGDDNISIKLTSESDLKQYIIRRSRSARKPRSPAHECDSEANRYALLPRKGDHSDCKH